MKRTTLFCVMLSALLCFSCGGKRKSYDEMGSNGLTTRTENLQANLRTFVNKGVLVGQQYGTLEGIGWRGDSVGRSDIQSICDDSPACSGYELCGIEQGQKLNADSIAFTAIRQDALRLFRRGGLLLMTWTMPDYRGDDRLFETWTTRLADYLASLQDDYGIKAPVVLLLCPQDGRSWYTRLSPEDYKLLLEKTISRLKDLEVSNALYGCSWTRLDDKQRVESSLPDGIDVLNLSLLQSRGTSPLSLSDFNRHLSALMELAQSHNLAPGLTTGIEGLPSPDYFSGTLLSVIRQHRLSYILFGPNRGEFRDGHFYVPYPGCDNRLIDDFVKFYNDDATIFLNGLNGLYLKK
ncbi:MAG: hypothetical protein I3J02_08085 [Prevotella sp.]|nr:hypothetical protein [Prevotella sp.]